MPTSDVPAPAGGYRNVPVSAPGYDSSIPVLPDGDAPDLTDSLLVSTDDLNKAAARAAAPSSEAAEAAARIAAVAHPDGTPWGDDPLGQGFGAVFAEPRASLLKVVGELPKVLDGVAERLRAAGRAYADAEDENIRTAKRLFTGEAA
ncbi:hypothetical protein ACQP2X_17600 [Actinoplanes sp. CA-131856]